MDLAQNYYRSNKKKYLDNMPCVQKPVFNSMGYKVLEWCLLTEWIIVSWEKEIILDHILGLKVRLSSFLLYTKLFKMFSFSSVRSLEFFGPYRITAVSLDVTLHLFFISNYDQASALKVAYIFKVFVPQSCLMIA